MKDQMKGGERISQRTHMHDPYTQTTAGAGHREGGWVRVEWRLAKGCRGEMGTPVIVSSIKKRRLHFFDPGSEAQNICMT